VGWAQTGSIISVLPTRRPWYVSKLMILKGQIQYQFKSANSFTFYFRNLSFQFSDIIGLLTIYVRYQSCVGYFSGTFKCYFGISRYHEYSLKDKPTKAVRSS
jgi:hypothetical protein